MTQALHTYKSINAPPILPSHSPHFHLCIFAFNHHHHPPTEKLELRQPLRKMSTEWDSKVVIGSKAKVAKVTRNTSDLNGESAVAVVRA